ncbi:hypothetical protein D3P07_10245 [Paenibacillus sp. 1011MAR3C5]|uniref:hypothetical protein n=1 Tax=Paenibacillus sp. 1011MAR3C5 TaxID=1675787 RepID=UPI000E6B6CA6|nr:hypothetical protein [Paenibacillus sp. 1011MAR3C5]RJE88379.1 hypothetical protein D3P07_10245 [Paenibacillus sp. 1011MAR3C5]
MRMKRSVYIVSAILCLTLLISGGLSYIYWSEPLKLNGNSTMSYSDGSEEIVFHLTNSSRTAIKLHEVMLNGKPHEETTIGISIDTGQFVQIGTDNEGIHFFSLEDTVVQPDLTTAQKVESIKKKEGKPIHYGVRLVLDDDVLQQLTLVYSFYGFRVTRTYQL